MFECTANMKIYESFGNSTSELALQTCSYLLYLSSFAGRLISPRPYVDRSPFLIEQFQVYSECYGTDLMFRIMILEE